ncbi:glycosyltransferase family 4 protein [Gynurincola endophyticus]|uniref:glycosyltransferase family 4 protein n=1 Tax=Gynurincola endophyticus TaxID=2479004 RepID=UPI0013154051|nr:glycosyltransferase family 4 protein [Gynurincola endophyticus]
MNQYSNILMTDLLNKKIVFVANNAWSILNFRKEVILKFLELKAEVHVVSPYDDKVVQLIQLGCQHHVVEFDNRSTNLVKDIRLYYQLKRLYQRIAPDFIFHYVAKPNIYGSLAAHRLNIPSIAVVTGLGYAFAQKNWLYRMISALYKTAFKFPEEIWFLNQDDADLFIRNGLVNKKLVRVISGEGVDVDYFKANNLTKKTVFTFLMTGRLIKSKGVLLFAEAIERMQAQGYECKGVLVGTYDPTHPDTIQESFVQKWKNNDSFLYMGYQNDVRSILETAHCFVFPSYYPEGVPRSLMEAASMKLPIITTLHTGCKEVVVQGRNGYLVRPQSVNDLVDAMKAIMQLTPEQLKEMGEAGREHMILHFDVQQTIQNYKRAIQAYL